MDQWDYEGVTLIRYFGHKLSWRYLMSQHNESRLLVPRLVAILLAPVTGWDVRYEVGLTLFCTLLTSTGLNILILRSSSLTPIQKGCCSICATAAVFSCTQFEVLLFGAYYFVIPGMAVVWSLVLMQWNWSYAGKVFTCVALNVFATFSYINGLFLWFLLFPGLVLEAKRTGVSTSKRRSLQAMYLALAAITLIPYLRTYKRPIAHPSMAATFSEPLRMVQYYLSWIGAPFTGVNSRDIGPYAGGALLFLFVWISGYLIWTHRKNLGAAEIYCWVAIGGYAAVTGVSITVGRSGFGVELVYISRYQTFSLLLPAVMAPLGLLAINQRFSDLVGRYRATAVFCFLTGGGAALFLLAYRSGVGDLEQYAIMRHRAALGIEFVDVLAYNPLLALGYPRAAHIAVVRQALVPFHLPEISEEGDHVANSARSITVAGDARNGAFDAAIEGGNGTIHVAGWADIPGRHAKPAAAVLFEWKGSQGSIQPIAVILVGDPRPDVAQATHNADLVNTGFAAEIPRSLIPGPGILSAWALDVGTERAYQLALTKPVTK